MACFDFSEIEMRTDDNATRKVPWEGRRVSE
jgi:hypothetical protein